MGAPTRLAAEQTPTLVLISFPSHVATPLSPVFNPFDMESQTFFFFTCAEDRGSPLSPSMKTRSPIGAFAGGETISTCFPSALFVDDQI